MPYQRLFKSCVPIAVILITSIAHSAFAGSIGFLIREDVGFYSYINIPTSVAFPAYNPNANTTSSEPPLPIKSVEGNVFTNAIPGSGTDDLTITVSSKDINDDAPYITNHQGDKLYFGIRYDTTCGNTYNRILTLPSDYHTATGFTTDIPVANAHDCKSGNFIFSVEAPPGVNPETYIPIAGNYIGTVDITVSSPN